MLLIREGDMVATTGKIQQRPSKPEIQPGSAACSDLELPQRLLGHGQRRLNMGGQADGERLFLSRGVPNHPQFTAKAVGRDGQGLLALLPLELWI